MGIQSNLIIKESLSELADYLGVCQQTLVGWLTKYRKFGVSNIVIKPTRNKKSKIITSLIHQGLKKKLED